MLPDDIVKKIKFELSEIQSEIEAFKPLLKKCKIQEPDCIEMTALASVLHSFYNGIEKIFIIIAKNIDNNLPVNQKWHNELIINMKNNNDNRSSVIGSETFIELKKYLLFRHYYRHSYSWRLVWSEFSDLVFNIEKIWQKVYNEISDFIK